MVKSSRQFQIDTIYVFTLKVRQKINEMIERRGEERERERESEREMERGKTDLLSDEKSVLSSKTESNPE